MKKEIILILLLVLLLLFMPVKLSAQEMSTITVKGNELNNGVIILDITRAGRGYELQCNEGFAGCVRLKEGKYVMVELPKNHGIYDCKVVLVYPESTKAPETEERLGEYCLIAK